MVCYARDAWDFPIVSWAFFAQIVDNLKALLSGRGIKKLTFCYICSLFIKEKNLIDIV